VQQKVNMVVLGERDFPAAGSKRVKRRNSHVFEKAKDGFYVEPSWVSQRLFEVETFAPIIYDPACGWGTILHSARAAGYGIAGSDLVDRKKHRLKNFGCQDFLNDGFSRVCNFSIVCNPPFDRIEEFCVRALKFADKVAMIMLTRRLNAAHWLRDLPLKTVYLLSPRPSMPPGAWIAAGNKPGGGTQDFCWLVMDSKFKGVPQLKWLHRDCEVTKQQRASVMTRFPRCRSGPSRKPNRSASTSPRNFSNKIISKSTCRKS
jgi:hypothetical protein